MDKLDLEKINKCLQTEHLGKKIIYFDEIDSTSNYAKEIWKQNIDGTIIIAEKQTKGRGRQGNNWVSPSGVGIWMSIIIKPKIETKDVTKFSSLIGLAVRKALSKATDLDVGIKWPNDIIINKKKVCGILVESIIENEVISSIIVGIGVNVNQSEQEFSQELSHASSLMLEKGVKLSREEIIHDILMYVEKYYDEFTITKRLDIKELKESSVLMSKKVVISYNNSSDTMIGNVVGFLEDGSILIENEEKKIININSSKVSIRGLQDYLD